MNPGIIATPKVVPIGDRVCIRIEPTDGAAPWPEGAAVPCRFFPKVNRYQEQLFQARAGPSGSLELDLSFPSPGEYILQVVPEQGDGQLSEPLFAVEDAMMALRPFKADLHMHTTHSDGAASVLEMALSAGRAGMDAIAITDHDVRAPLSEARQVCERMGLELTLIEGEEITVRGHGGHLLCLGAAGPIGPHRHDADTEKAVNDILNETSLRGLPAALPRDTYAHLLWTARRARQRGGLLIIAHPYWEGTRGWYYPAPDIVDRLIEDGLIDGVEVFGGSASNEGDMLALSRVAAAMGAGARPIMSGGSDAHRAEDVGRLWTLILAPSRQVVDLLEALRSRRCVACNDRITTQQTLAFGPFELMMYAGFLLREYFPRRDPRCRELGKIATRAAMGQVRAGDEQRSVELRRELATLQRCFWHETSADARGAAKAGHGDGA